ncbi:Probable sensor histidine kinase TcrY [Actinomyces howellii]|uniref:histidine kinase n=1 Tax=Actinomyces howellii TaxID=52771 RepID=A0A448HIR8_9ACTO|nr:Probable sensor histidine kinase TcrY [Actinomyces howellii]
MSVRTSRRARRGVLRAAHASRPPGRQHRPTKRGRWHPLTTARRTWHSQPLRSRLALITTGLLTFGLLIASLTFTSLLETHLIRQVDDQLRATGQEVGTQGIRLMDSGSVSSMPSTYFVAVRYADGRSGLLISDETASKYGSPSTDDLGLDDPDTDHSGSSMVTVDSDKIGSDWRVVTLSFVDENTGEELGVVAVGLPLKDVAETVEVTRFVVALTDVTVILVGAMAATYLVRRALRPLRQIEGVAGRIASGDLSARVPLTEPATTEVGSLQRALNTMLQRNEQAFEVQVVAQERMTRFVSDASHELRTPLSAIRGYGELYRMGGVPAERTDEVMARIESESSRMGRLVEDLLQLARMDEGRKMVMAPVDLTAVAAGALTDMMVLAPERDCSLLALDPQAAAQGAEPGPVTVVGDKDRLSQVLTNLLGNVVRHTPEGSPVEVAVGTVPARESSIEGTTALTAVVEVRDHGPGVPIAEAEKVFERFYRADTSRNRETGGSGLGLAIVAAIVGRHGGVVRMLPTPGGGATVRIEIPTAAAGAPSPS